MWLMSARSPINKPELRYSDPRNKLDYELAVDTIKILHPLFSKPLERITQNIYNKSGRHFMHHRKPFRLTGPLYPPVCREGFSAEPMYYPEPSGNVSIFGVLGKTESDVYIFTRKGYDSWDRFFIRVGLPHSHPDYNPNGPWMFMDLQVPRVGSASSIQPVIRDFDANDPNSNDLEKILQEIAKIAGIMPPIHPASQSATG